MNALVSLLTPQRAKLRAADFHILAEAGAFEGYAKSELIEGDIWVMNAVHVWHSKAMTQLTLALGPAVQASGLPLRLYLPVSVDLSDDSVPEPDLVIGDDHDDGPLPFAKVRLAIEVSDGTLDFDLGPKARMYARAGVPEYWVVARDGAKIVQHWTPEADTYVDKRDVRFGEPLESATIAGLIVDTTGLV